MKQTKQSLSELWALLRNEEKKHGLEKFSLTERDILQTILYLKGNNKQISLEYLQEACSHPRATFFRCLKKLRSYDIVDVIKDSKDARKSFIKVSPKLTI